MCKCHTPFTSVSLLLQDVRESIGTWPEESINQNGNWPVDNFGASLATVCVKGLQSQPNGLLCQVKSCQTTPNWWRLTNGVRLSCCRRAEILACNSDGLVQAFLLGRLLQPQSQLSNQEMQDRWKKNSRSEWSTEMAPRSWQSQDMIPIDSSWHLGKFSGSELT